jgi:hypothetical protein
MAVYVSGNNVEPQPMSRQTKACQDLQAQSPERARSMLNLLAGNDVEVALLVDSADIAVENHSSTTASAPDSAKFQ